MSPPSETTTTTTTIKPSPDLESAPPSTVPHRKHPLIPGFTNPPPFLTFLRHNWYDIGTQLFCLAAALLLYSYCPPLMPRYFSLFPGIYHTAWGMQHSQPYLHEYITTLVSAVVSFAIPALVMGGVALWGTRGFGDGDAAVSSGDDDDDASGIAIGKVTDLFMNKLMGLGYALSTSTLFISILKVFVGGLRPHFLTVCKPVIPPSSLGLDPAQMFYTPDQVCAASASKIKEAQMSFPSGHSSAAFAGFGFLALYLNAKFKIFSRGAHFRDYYGSREPDAGTARVHHWKTLLWVAPWLIALLLALSKIRDRWHHPIDVIFGALVGILFAHMAYSWCYRSVYDWRDNHIPLEGDGGEKEE